jgi:hypothetical protein
VTIIFESPAEEEEPTLVDASPPDTARTWASGTTVTVIPGTASMVPRAVAEVPVSSTLIVALVRPAFGNVA